MMFRHPEAPARCATGLPCAVLVPRQTDPANRGSIIMECPDCDSAWIPGYPPTRLR